MSDTNDKKTGAPRSLDGLVVSDASHWLECVHAIGGNRYTYHMRCVPLKTMNDGRLKVLVFGDRYWKNRNSVKRVRYVPAHRVFKMRDNR